MLSLRGGGCRPSKLDPEAGAELVTRGQPIQAEELGCARLLLRRSPTFLSFFRSTTPQLSRNFRKIIKPKLQFFPGSLYSPVQSERFLGGR